MISGHRLQFIKERTKNKTKQKKPRECPYHYIFQVTFALVPRWAVYSGMYQSNWHCTSTQEDVVIKARQETLRPQGHQLQFTTNTDLLETLRYTVSVYGYGQMVSYPGEKGRRLDRTLMSLYTIWEIMVAFCITASYSPTRIRKKKLCILKSLIFHYQILKQF